MQLRAYKDEELPQLNTKIKAAADLRNWSGSRYCSCNR